MRIIFGVFLTFFVSVPSFAQPNRLTARIDDSRRVRLQSTIHPLALRSTDEGVVDSSTTLQGMILYLKPTDTQRRSLVHFLEQIRSPSSPNFRKFLTPEQYADRFGISASDLAQIRGWLESQGFSIAHVARGRTWILFSGTAEQTNRAFQTEMHNYRLEGRLHRANSSNVAVPESLADMVLGVGSRWKFSASANRGE